MTLRFSVRQALGGVRGPGWVAVVLVAATMVGCRSAGDYRREADRVAYDVIDQKQREGLGRTEPFTIERPEDTLRRRLLIDQGLPIAGPASLGTRALEPIDHWPDDDYLDRPAEDEDNPAPDPPPAPEVAVTDAEPVTLSLIDALQVAARNSRTYQDQKEQVYRTALRLDLERDAFRNTFEGLLDSRFTTDQGGDDVVSGTVTSGTGSVTRRLRNGITLTSLIALDLARLLTQGATSSRGLLADASIEIPLLRGAGEWVVAEPLTQAERDALYAIWTFERFKRTFAVQVASEYLGVLRQLDEVQNSEENYRRLILASRRARRLADAGLLPEIQVDQAVQDELRARTRWISARERYASDLDQFKLLLGLPTDATIALDRGTLERLAAAVADVLEKVADVEPAPSAQVPPADAPVELVEPRRDAGGPLEMAEATAIRLALAHRLDLQIAQGEVYDAQRQVTVAANGFLPELTLLGRATAGERRSLGSTDLDNARLRFERGQYDALLSLDLPLERTAERNIYRNSLIALEQAVRNVQALEDQIKFEVRDSLRTLLESREGLRIQAQAVALAERRVESTNLFLQAGRAEIRDLLEAQEALVSAQNALTAALVSYRVAELNLQADLGLLEVNEQGLWREWRPGAP